MSGIGSIMNTAKQALLAQQVSIEVTGTNVANANSVGYSKQRAVLVPVSSAEAPQNDIQGGVDILTIQRLFDRFVERQISEQSAQVNYSETRQGVLKQVEALFNEGQRDGLSAVMGRFWKAWEDLSVNPAGDVERLAVVSAADNLSATFRDYANQLIDIQDSMDSQITENVTQLNSYLSEIATLNDRIIQTQAGGGNVNSLQDNRSELLKKVSEIVDINYIQQPDGSLNLFLSNGRALVQGNLAWTLSSVLNPLTHHNDVVFESDPATAINHAVTGGKLGALIDARDSDVQGYLDQLDTLAEDLIDAVNSQHAEGYDLNGNIGGLFFDDVAEAKDMGVDADLAADRSLLAASSTVNRTGQSQAKAAISNRMPQRSSRSSIQDRTT